LSEVESRRCIFVKDWECYSVDQAYCTSCLDARKLDMELRQKEHILNAQIEAFNNSAEQRKMRLEMNLWSVKKLYEAERKKLDAEKGG